MDEAHQKELAEMVLLLEERTTFLMDIVVGIIERDVESGKFPERANVLRSSVEQLSAISRDTKAARDQTRKRFGLE